jgi:hypothetical protein
MSLKKEWLDFNVVPLLKENHLQIHSFIWNGNPPKEVLVWLRTDPIMSHDCTRCHIPRDRPEKGVDCMTAGCSYSEKKEPCYWAMAVKNLLENGWTFDYLREQQIVMIEQGRISAFGGDGAPVFNPEGEASVRLTRKTEDGVSLILEIGCQFWPVDGLDAGKHAASAVKGFFAQFDTENPLEVCAKYAAPFGGQ